MGAILRGRHELVRRLIPQPFHCNKSLKTVLRGVIRRHRYFPRILAFPVEVTSNCDDGVNLIGSEALELQRSPVPLPDGPEVRRRSACTVECSFASCANGLFRSV